MVRNLNSFKFEVDVGFIVRNSVDIQGENFAFSSTLLDLNNVMGAGVQGDFDQSINEELRLLLLEISDKAIKIRNLLNKQQGD